MAKKRPEKRETLLQATIRELTHRDRLLTYEVIAKATGVSTAFLASLLSANPPANPGVDSIQRVYEFITGREVQY